MTSAALLESPRTAPLLATADLHASLTDPALNSMTLLNEITGDHPDAVSFAAGRPYEGHYRTEALHRHLRRYTRYLEQERGLDQEQVRRVLFQYGPTKGIINELVVRQLRADESITAGPESVVVTTGCQEAMVLLLRALRRDAQDVVLAVAPTYVGFIGAARLTETTVRLVPERPGGLDAEDLARAVAAARADGLRPRACYVIPDFSNPGGSRMSLEDRRRLLSVAEETDILIIEDNPYSMFHDGQGRLPTLKSLDTSGRVVYIGSYAKTAYPSARIGYVVADQPVTQGGLFADQLAKLKSMLTLNTSALAQAAIGGLLLENDCSMDRACAREAAVYRRNLRALLDGLEARFPRAGDSGVTWNVPAGGLFAVLTVPFTADEEALEESARRFGVLWTPMHHFYAGTGGHNQLRLSYSVLTPRQIAVGLDRLAALVESRSGRR
ncbi:aminotransferase class I/II-fold pyridoxal phosphate-dependent enzyme [Streptomyces sp. NPDC007904]|uniref:aminotransferase-like domain-containing protein n=1 Tax=Streptomyces sp. NPDC007904 TaxID=3364787 RepID=UPI0036F12E12